MDYANQAEFLETLEAFNKTVKEIGGCDEGACLLVVPEKIFGDDAPKGCIETLPKGNCKCWMDKIKMLRYFHAVGRMRKRLDSIAIKSPLPKTLKGITKVQPKRRVVGKWE